MSARIYVNLGQMKNILRVTSNLSLSIIVRMLAFDTWITLYILVSSTMRRNSNEKEICTYFTNAVLTTINRRGLQCARCCSNSLGTRASSGAVLMSSSRAPVVVPIDFASFVSAHQFFQHLESWREGLIVCTDLEPGLVARAPRAFPTQRILTTDQTSQRLKT